MTVWISTSVPHTLSPPPSSGSATTAATRVGGRWAGAPDEGRVRWQAPRLDADRGFGGGAAARAAAAVVDVPRIAREEKVQNACSTEHQTVPF